jgi:hypothetical protein
MKSLPATRLFLLIAWSAMTAAAMITSNSVVADTSGREAAIRARDVLSARCLRCHGANGVAKKNVFVLDRGRLVASRIVVPGYADSLLLKVIESGAMPMGGPALNDEEKAILRKWIEIGAPDWDTNNPSAGRRFITEAELMSSIREDLLKTNERVRPYLRYFSLAHLYNSNVSDEELETYRVALAKLINSLSWHREITLPSAVDPQKTVYRIDLRDYNWTAAIWNQLLAAYPYGVRSQDSEIISILSGVSLPYVRADWFASIASTPPLYHELLGLPNTIAELERLLGIDTARNLEEEKNVVRAGIRASGVSQNNRVLERHVSSYGAYWKSFDFQSNLDNQNIFRDPIRFNAAGGEMIFNLPNGLQAYFLVDRFGRRLDAAPIDIVSDRTNPDDPIIRNGRSCIGCHFDGIKSFKDDVRQVVGGMTVGFFNRDRALALYPPQESLDQLVERDRQIFQTANEKVGSRIISGADREPINALARRHLAELSSEQAAAETGLEYNDFQARVRRSARLIALGFGQVLVPGGAVKRDVWDRHFGETVRELQIGDYVSGQRVNQRASTFNTAPAGSLPVRRGLTGLSPESIMGSAKTIFIHSRTMFLKAHLMADELSKRPEFRTLGLQITREEKKADIRIELDRPPWTFIYEYTLIHPETSVLLLKNKEVAFEGTLAAPKIAKKILESIVNARQSSAR